MSLAADLGARHSVDRFAMIVLEEFLAPPIVDWLRTFAIDHQQQFTSSYVLASTNASPRIDPSVRRSRVLHDVGPEVAELLRTHVRRVLPDVLIRLDKAPHEPANIDVQLSVSEHQGHFRGHIDTSDDLYPDRRLSFVCFLHSEPKAFSGGRLRLVERLGNDGTISDAIPHIDVEPLQNRIVFFAPQFLHEVSPVNVPSGRFEDSRLTANGWIRW